MKLINLFRRACLWFVIRSLQTELSDIQNAMRTSLSVEQFTAALIRQTDIKRELQKAQHEYSALLPVGVVRTWAI